MPKLNERQKQFADYYLEMGNMRKAALRAGYSRATADKPGEKLMKSPAVKAYLEERIAEMDAERIAGAWEVMAYLTRVMRGEGAEGEKAGTRERLRAAELLGKRYCIFNEKLKPDELVPVIILGGEDLKD